MTQWPNNLLCCKNVTSTVCGIRLFCVGSVVETMVTIEMFEYHIYHIHMTSSLWQYRITLTGNSLGVSDNNGIRQQDCDAWISKID